MEPTIVILALWRGHPFAVRQVSYIANEGKTSRAWRKFPVAESSHDEPGA